jgi:hypothetical protein
MKSTRLWALPAAAIALTFASSANAQHERIVYPVTVRAESKMLNEDEALVTYRFNGDPEKEYLITAVMLSPKDSTFRVEVDDAEGDIGEGYFADGRDHSFRWNVREVDLLAEILKGKRNKYGGFDSFATLLHSGEYYFEVTAIELVGQGNWFLYAAGVGVLGATAAYLYLEENEWKERVLPPDR